MENEINKEGEIVSTELESSSDSGMAGGESSSQPVQSEPN